MCVPLQRKHKTQQHQMTRYTVKILLAFGCTFEPGSDEIFEWLMKNGYPELGAFSRAIQGEAKAKEWLMKNGFLQLVAIDNVIDKDENAEEWLLRNHFEVDLAFARAINCDDDATEWLEKRELQVFVIIAKKIRKNLDDKYLDYHKIHF